MSSLLDIAGQIRSGQRSAADVLEDCLARVRADSSNAFTAITEARARREAASIDARRASGEPLPPLAGVPYAVKNLFDVAGLVTLAGGHVNAGNAPAQHDGPLIARLQAAGAVLVGTLNMDEHAYGFTTENSHYGACRNPHDTQRIAGGSSGGSAAAVAAGLVPLTLGSDTNGSIRVPASLCGIFGLKPTYGRLPRSGSFPFVYSLDHLGPLASSAQDLAAAYDVLQGPWHEDPVCAQRAPEAVFPLGTPRPLRVGILGGYFHDWSGPQARRSVAMAAEVLGARDVVELPDVEAARAAAFIITGAEGGALHQKRLIDHYAHYEPYSRDRLVAGSLIPATWVMQAQGVRRRFQQAVLPLFERFDVLISAATPVPATMIGTETLTLNGQSLPARASMGLLTQPISCIGLPAAVAPLWQGEGSSAHLPLGVQLIAPPWREDLCLAAAQALEVAGLAVCRRPKT
ncbi:Asp-tRNA(Asn)/Glu-tRNA(Gln) amidotransferase GatCAB subunit A [Bordetella avium]|uniref:AtzE family amidohydrolase n=1 Tax=Bordetella avium TaxID=521 RepID=UPI000FDAA042|nr:AtzE family amidohydrolase [Bordetella avium]AZY49936.1 Asp-tRNA(Asn)/Glu-tRNA(Gln) amidotransferase GatCAB subunit A [Bordetella avium]